MAKLTSEIEVPCPCCGATLVIDTNLARPAPPPPAARGHPPHPGYANNTRRAAEARREALFEQSFAAEQGRDDALSRRFEEALKQAHTEPITKPTRDFDLD